MERFLDLASQSCVEIRRAAVHGTESRKSRSPAMIQGTGHPVSPELCLLRSRKKAHGFTYFSSCFRQRGNPDVLHRMGSGAPSSSSDVRLSLQIAQVIWFANRFDARQHMILVGDLEVYGLGRSDVSRFRTSEAPGNRNHETLHIPRGES